MNAEPQRPLAGLVLLESHHATAPLCLRLAKGLATRIAADLGAQVITLEPAGGDVLRQHGPWIVRDDGARASALFEFLNASKTLLRLPHHPATAISTLLEGRIDGVFAEEGDPVLAQAAARGIDTVELTGFPDASPAAGAPLTEFGVLAFSAMLDMIGDPQREPLRLGGHQPAYAAGMSAFTAMMALLEGRAAGRGADHARISLVETLIWVNWKAISGAQATGRAPTRRGAKAEFQVFPCLDGHIALVFTVNQYDALVRLIGDPALAEPRFANRASRTEQGEAFVATLAPWFAQRRREDIYQAAQALGVPLGPVFDAHDLLNDAQHLARDFIRTLEHPTLGTLHMPRLPVLWGDVGFAPRTAQEAS
jgi:crotonobetainyl-CoA:carnitine CoA-transferase CaiB-like acyl-CoA transferase